MVSSSALLYDFDGALNGYVYNLTTNREETGYIQLFYDSGVYSLVGFTYEGRHFIEKMLDAYNLKTTLRYNTTEKKLVYAGGMDYLIFDSKNSCYYNLNNQTFVENDKLSEIKTNYQRISTEILACESYIQSNGV